jgi:hypothetical protein
MRTYVRVRIRTRYHGRSKIHAHAYDMYNYCIEMISISKIHLYMYTHFVNLSFRMAASRRRRLILPRLDGAPSRAAVRERPCARSNENARRNRSSRRRGHGRTCARCRPCHCHHRRRRRGSRLGERSAGAGGQRGGRIATRVFGRDCAAARRMWLRQLRLHGTTYRQIVCGGSASTGAAGARKHEQLRRGDRASNARSSGARRASCNKTHTRISIHVHNF